MNHDLDLFRSIVNELMNEEEKEVVVYKGRWPGGLEGVLYSAF